MPSLFVRVLGTVALLSVLAGTVGAQERPRASAKDLRISFIDVGQGDSIWIQTPADGDRPSENRYSITVTAGGSTLSIRVERCVQCGDHSECGMAPIRPLGDLDATV